MVNKVILLGRLGRDPETRYTGGGQAVANFSVATEESFKDRTGARQKRTEWHEITVWGKQAEIAQQYLKKGSMVFIEGRLQTQEWQDKEGQARKKTVIVATNFRMVGDRPNGQATSAAPQQGGRPAQTPNTSQSRGGYQRGAAGAGARQNQNPPPQDNNISDEDIPF